MGTTENNRLRLVLMDNRTSKLVKLREIVAIFKKTTRKFRVISKYNRILKPITKWISMYRNRAIRVDFLKGLIMRIQIIWI